MRRISRLVVTAASALATLAFASSALASYAPKLVVSVGTGNSTRVGVVVGSADDPTVKTTIYVPAAYGVATPAPGTKLGDVTATAAAADLGGAVLPFTGELDAIAPTATTTVVAQACGVTPTQTWDLHLTAATQAIDIPMFVVSTVGPEQAAGFNTELVVCLPPPDVPIGTPGRAPFGAKLLSATFTASAITRPASAGDYRWTSVWTPYTPGKGTPNAAGTVETQSLQHVPVKLTTSILRKRVVTYRSRTVGGKKMRVKVIATSVSYSSKVTENGHPPSSAVIVTGARGKKIGGAKGSFLMKGVKSVKLAVVAAVDSDSGSVPTGQTAKLADLFFHDLGASSCTATPIFQGVPCIGATVGGEVFGNVITVRAFRK